jgi:hypothetical protein
VISGPDERRKRKKEGEREENRRLSDLMEGGKERENEREGNR